MLTPTQAYEKGMTPAELHALGWIDAHTSWTQGYISVKRNPEQEPVNISHYWKGGRLYYLERTNISNAYCLRVYMRPPR